MIIKTPDNRLGYSIKAAREARMMTQEKLAELIGVSTVYIPEIENKRSAPSFMLLYRICRLLNVSVDDVIFHTESDSARKISRMLSQCSEKQLKVIQAMIEAMLAADSEQ